MSKHKNVTFTPFKKEDIHFLKMPGTSVEEKNLGIDYDWTLIRQLWRKLGCPKEVYDPTHLPLETHKYFISTSSRSVGKTTNTLLLLLCAAWKYGSQIIYVRQREAMIEKKYLDNKIGLFSVIRAFDYISKITEGEYNDAEYYARVWRFVQRDETGKIIKKSDPYIVCVDIDQAETYKSTLAAPFGDFIIFDEFISRDYHENEFCQFCDLVKTIIRDRFAPVIFCLANTTDIYNPYLREFGIQNEMASLGEGDNCTVKTRKGTMIYCERVGAKNQARPYVNTMFFGFDNQRLSAITGGGDWVIDAYPHIERDSERSIVGRGYYLKFQDEIVELELCSSPTLGLHILAHKADKVNEKARIVYTLTEIRELREAYQCGTKRPIDKLIWGLYSANKFYFSDNSIGNIVDHYIAACHS